MTAIPRLLSRVTSEFRGIAIRRSVDDSGSIEFAHLVAPGWDVDFRVWEFGGEIRADLDGCELLLADSSGGGLEVLTLLRELRDNGFTVARQQRPDYIRVTLGTGGGRVVGACGLRLPWIPLKESVYPPWSGSS
jgi:hypothetical protein